LNPHVFVIYFFLIFLKFVLFSLFAATTEYCQAICLENWGGYGKIMLRS